MAERLASGEEVQTELGQLVDAIVQFASSNPAVIGVHRLLKRAQRDMRAAETLVEQLRQLEGAGADMTFSGNCTLVDQLQGAQNNIRGMWAELDVAQHADNVICLGAKFHSQVSAGMPVFSLPQRKPHLVEVINLRF